MNDNQQQQRTEGDGQTTPAAPAAHTPNTPAVAREGQPPRRQGTPLRFEFHTQNKQDERDAVIARDEIIRAVDAILAANPTDNYDAVLDYLRNNCEVADYDPATGCYYLALPAKPAHTKFKDGEYARCTEVFAGGATHDTVPATRRDLFDNKDKQLRDEEAATIKRKHNGIIFLRGRKQKAIQLTARELRVLAAIACYATHPEEIRNSKDVINKIDDPYGDHPSVRRSVDLADITRMIYGKSRTNKQLIVLQDLRNIAKTDQRQILPSGRIVNAPLISLEEFTDPIVIGDGTHHGRRAGGGDLPTHIHVQLGTYFFSGARYTYAPIYPTTLFAAWRKNGRGTDLFARLLFELLFVYVATRRSISHIYKEVKKDNPFAPADTLDTIVRRRVKKAKLNEVTLSVDTLKALAERDYESSNNLRRQFWRDLDEAIEGVKEIGIAAAATPTTIATANGKAPTAKKGRPSYITITLNLAYGQPPRGISFTPDDNANDNETNSPSDPPTAAAVFFEISPRRGDDPAT